MVRINLFGKIQVSGENGNPIPVSRKSLELLALVALNHHMGRDQVAELLWEEAGACRAKKYLRNCLWQLRQSISRDGAGNELLTIDQDWLELRGETLAWVDAAEFSRICSDIAAVPPDCLSEDCFESMKRAIALYRGELLSGWYQEWCLIERERFQSKYFVLVEKLFDGCLAKNKLDDGRLYGGLLLEAEPTRESSHRRLMELHARVGDRSAALRQFQQCTQILEKEFGVGPCERTVALYNAICTSSGERGEIAELVVPRQVSESARESSQLSDLIKNIAILGQALAKLHGELEQIKGLLVNKPANHMSQIPKSRRTLQARQRRAHN